jgi:dTDP-4-dehydrorhamnose reductase
MDGLLRRIQPEAVIHAAAIADVGLCQRHPDRTADINIDVPARLAAWCARRDVPFGFTSTDLVFDGERAPYDEACPVNPINSYARQKARAEANVLKMYNKAAVFRLPLLIGVSGRNDTYHFCHRMFDAIYKGEVLSLFTDEYRTPVDIGSAAAGILSMLGRVEGVLHLGGRTRISRYELGLMMAEAMGRVPDMIQAVRIADIPSIGQRAADVALDSRRAFDLGYSPMPLNAAVKLVVGQYIIKSNG